MLNSNQNNNLFGKSVVVVALLDWGLGHVTRTVPIIKELINKNCHIIAACNPRQKSLLVREFDQIEFVDCEGYDIRYRKSSLQTRLALIWQIPKILIKINREHRWLSRFLEARKVDLVISDNRYGFFSHKLPSVIITHQLEIKSGLGRWVDGWANSINRRLLSKFKECWIPDFQGNNSIAGELSHPRRLPSIPLRYLGALSRLEPCTSLAPTQKHQLLVLLSGPEPQRTMLEEKILADAKDIPSTEIILVRGLPSETSDLANHPSNVQPSNHLPAAELNKAICSADYIVSRSGYTSLMDYLKLGVKSILIPTPGQAEQEYLASYLQENQFALSFEQSGFSLASSLEQASHFAYRKFEGNMDEYKAQLSEFLASISKD